MLHHFRKQAATLAVNSIQNEAICAEQPVKSYSTTLLATVALRTDNELFAAAFWLGDGAMVHTALPVKSGYWEIPIAENTQDKPAFLTRALSQTPRLAAASAWVNGMMYLT